MVATVGVTSSCFAVDSKMLLPVKKAQNESFKYCIHSKLQDNRIVKFTEVGLTSVRHLPKLLGSAVC